MKKGKITGILLMTACMATFTTGCVDAMPDLTDEQSELIAEYAAELLLKYSPNYNYKIADDSEVEAVLAKENTFEPEPEESSEIEETVSADENSTGDVAETAVEDNQNSEEQSQDSNMISVAEATALEQTLGFEGFNIKYYDYEIDQSYPSGGDSSGFSVNAPNGKSLLVLHFDVTNQGTEAAECDFLGKQISIQANVNDSGYRKSMNTLLVNDMNNYMEEIQAGDTKDIIALVTVNEQSTEEIETLTVRLSDTEGSIEIKIK